MKILKKNKALPIFFLIIFGISILYRIPNLATPFWVDEFSTARNASVLMKNGLKAFYQPTEFFEHHNVTEHLLVALFFQLFGISETSARLPSVLIGSAVPILVFLVGRKLYDRNAAIAATLYTMFSYFEITWSRQARSYVLQQFILLLTLWVYAELIKKFSRLRFGVLLLCFVIGLLTHSTFIFFLFALFLHFVYLCYHWQLLQKDRIKKLIPYALVIAIGVGLFLLNNYGVALIGGVRGALETRPNNVWYYHSFLWREQTLITFLAVIGVLLNFLKYKKGTFLVLVPILSYLFFVCFLFPPYVSRYLLPIFPLLFILAGYAVATIASSLSTRFPLLLVLVVVFFIIANGDTFVTKPKRFYSVNHDMREIALIDYNQVYQKVKDRPGVAMIDTWPDRARWYLGYDYPHIYYFHWENQPGSINGMSRETQVTLNGNEKTLPGFTNPPIRFIGSLKDLQLMMTKYPQGFIWIDDTSLPADVIDYAKKNFKQELYLDHYPLDDNPYSIWPGTLYSWGFENSS